MIGQYCCLYLNYTERIVTELYSDSRKLKLVGYLSSWRFIWCLAVDCGYKQDRNERNASFPKKLNGCYSETCGKHNQSFIKARSEVHSTPVTWSITKIKTF